jgi:hypothetical protein
MTGPVDRDQLAALLALRRRFGDVQVLDVAAGEALLEQLRRYPAGTLATLRGGTTTDPSVPADQPTLFPTPTEEVPEP